MQKLTREQLYQGLARAKARQQAEAEEKARALEEAKQRRSEARKRSILSRISKGTAKPVKREYSAATWSPRNANTAMDQLVRNLVDEGCTLKQIEERAQLTPRQLKHYLYDRLKIKLKTSKKRAGLSEDFIKQCIAEKRSYNWIANTIGWPYTTLLGRLRQMGYDKVLTQRKWYNDDKERVRRNMDLIRRNHFSVIDAMDHMTETEAKYAHKQLLLEVAAKHPGGTFMKFHQAPCGSTIGYSGEILVKQNEIKAFLVDAPKSGLTINHTSRVYLIP